MSIIQFIVRWIELQWLKRRARFIINTLRDWKHETKLTKTELRAIYGSFRSLEDELYTIMKRCMEIDPDAPRTLPKDYP